MASNAGVHYVSGLLSARPAAAIQNLQGLRAGDFYYAQDVGVLYQLLDLAPGSYRWQEVPAVDLVFAAGADLSLSQYRFVQLDGSGQVVLSTTTSGYGAIGVLQNSPGLGQSALVRLFGVTPIRSGSALVPNTYLSSDAGGRAVVLARTAVVNTNDAPSATDPVIATVLLAQSLASAGGADVNVLCVLRIGGMIPATPSP